jgi:hypothetical protein
LIVIAEESRSQHDNKARALRRLRQAIYLKIRNDVTVESLATVGLGSAESPIRLDLGRKDARFWPTVGVVLDALQTYEAKVSEAAAALGITTANLVDFLETEPKVWEQANILRARFGHKPLRT